jgi:autotransporter-associated beta strand protein
VPASTTADTATWNATSLGPSLTGNISTRKVTVNGATNNITHSGTITLGADGFEFAPTNNRTWTQSGVIAIGANAQTWLLSNTLANSSIWLSAAGGLTGSANLALSSNNATANWPYAYAYFQLANAGYTGTITLNANVGLMIGAAGSLTAANFAVSGDGSALLPAASALTLGAAGKTLTINNDCQLSYLARSFTIAPNVVLAGTGTRTLTVNGSTTMSGTVTGSNGLIATGASAYTNLALTGTSSGLSGDCELTSVYLYAPRPTGYIPSSLVLNANSSFLHYNSTSDYTSTIPVSGTGRFIVSGSFAGNGATFPASPATGNIATFAGTLAARAGSASGQEAAKVVISELPATLAFHSYASVATPALSAAITYTGAGQSKNTALNIDSEDSGSTAALTAGAYSLLASGSGPLSLSGTVTRTNSSYGRAAQASARMSLTLGGTNTGNNTLSGDISEVGTNSAILGLTKVDAGRWVLSGNNSHTGIHSISAGTLSAQSNTALGSATSSGGVSITGTGTLELSGGITLNKSNTSFTFRPGAAFTAIQDTSVVSIGNNTLRHGGIVLVANTNLHVSTGNRLALTGGVISGAFAVSKWGNGELDLGSDAHTYSGALNIEDGTLAVANLKAAGTACSLGTNAAAVTIWSDAVTPTILKYVGTENTTTNRVLYFRSGGANHRAGLDASGSGYVWYSSIQEGVSAGHTLLLQGTSTADNRITANMNNFETIAKNDAGTWSLTGTISVLNAAMVVNLGRLVLSGALSHTAPTTVNGGTLRVATANRNSTSGTVTVAAGGTVELVTDTLASTSSSSGEVLGTSDVSVNGGTIKTRGGSSAQKGQVRYGGNLTFGAGSRLEIGTAA